MGAWTLKWGAEGLSDWLHWRKPTKPNGAAAPAEARPGTATSPRAPREVSERRAEAMRGFFPKLSAWLAHRSYLAEMREVDGYLSQATDMFDLERRIRHIERQGATARWF